ncbi:MAG TPA: 50S ribosomal protein L31 [Gammaproteobacteria bacterium]|nr:50S ribosomal protein L31 [Gammaproteobacteria bacterium]
MSANAEIHPKLFTVETKCTGCGNKMTLSSPLEESSLCVETCHKCHPAYTGEKRALQAGAVEKFNQKYAGFYASKKQSSDKAKQS